MDTSPEYIHQSDCPEIQEKWEPKIGDVISSGDGIEIIGSILIVSDHQATKGGYDYDDFYFDWKKAIWLPRQAQLQKLYLDGMPGGTYQKIATLAEVFHDFYEEHGYPVYATSMEQLWLGFYMSEHFGKVWSGTEWEV